MKIRNLISGLLIILSGYGYAQQIYQVGVSQNSIEPDNNLMSLTLGGYAIPWEGRFVLQWITKDEVSAVTAIAGNLNKVYIIRNDSVYWNYPNPSGNISSWKYLTTADNVEFMTASDKALFAIDGEDNLLKCTLGKNDEKWDNIKSDITTVTALAANKNQLFVASNDGSLWTTDISDENFVWSKTNLELDNIISMAAHKSYLYAITQNGKIYRRLTIGQNNKWLKFGYKNDVTVTQDVQHIAISGNTMYAVCRENILYEGEYRSKGDLSARAMAIKDGNNTTVIVGIDVVGVNDAFIKQIKEEIYKTSGLPPSAVFINASHTHFAPVTQDWLTWQEPNQKPDSTYLWSVVWKGILASVEGALENLQPARLYFGRGSTDIGYNRSLEQHPELYDNDVDVIRVVFDGEEKENFLFIAACHPVFSTDGKLNYTISANFPGVARKLIEDRTGSSNSIFLQGAAGDINPVNDDEYLTGKRLANDVYSVIYKSMDRVSGPISHFIDTINFPIQIKSKEEILEFKTQNLNKKIEELGDLEGLETYRNINWSNLMLDYYEQNTMPSALPVYIHTINIGNWKLIGFSRETTSEYSLRTKNIWPGELVSVVGYTNDVSSYLPTSKHIEEMNYEGYGSFLWYGMPNTFPKTIEETIINYIKEKYGN